ncbi:centrosomal protein of 63 kDa isoform X1 [Syngnathus acus]|uniref:centrosomal protein of 63 kDa isoform X1 n=1 Tax=Syngnathus acus TaxID=161584 RepID=UPI0018861E06|nr:centrosomal protein of 63 kDa isoform X1 [Syngnathus acus]
MEACLGSLLNSDLSSVLSACEPELQELMRQIDIMMSMQRSEWETQIRDLQQQLKGGQEDISTSRVIIQRKDLEIGVLRKQVEDIQAGRHDLATKYEKQLGKVSEELDKLKRNYQKLERRHIKKGSTEESKDEDVSEVRVLKEKLEEYSQRLVVYQTQLAELEAHKNSLNEELAHVKAQRASERLHADCCMDAQRMRSQLDKVHHDLHVQEMELERFRALANTRLSNDRWQRQDKTEEIERLHKDVSTLKHMLHDKERAISSLEECLTSHDAGKLREDLQRASAELDRARTCEAHLNAQVTRLKERLEETSVQHAKVQQEARVLKDAFDTSVAEVKRLREELSRAEQRHSGDTDDVRKQAEASSAASLASHRESSVTEQPQLRPELTQTTRPRPAGDGPTSQGHTADDPAKTVAESSSVSEGTSFDGDIQRLFTQLRSTGSRQPPGEQSALTKRALEGRSFISPSPPDASQVDATVSHYLEKEMLHSKELLHKMDTHILGMGDSHAATVAKCLNAKTS